MDWFGFFLVFGILMFGLAAFMLLAVLTDSHR